MAAIGNLAAEWARRLPAPEALTLGWEARRASLELITEQREASQRAAQHAADALRAARTIASGSYSSSVVATCATLVQRGMRPAVQLAASGSGPRAHGQRLAGALEALGLQARVVPDDELEKVVVGSDALVLGADAIDPTRAVVNGHPSAALAQIAQRQGVPTTVVGTRARVTRNVHGLSLAPEFEHVPGGLGSQVIMEDGPADAATLRRIADCHAVALAALREDRALQSAGGSGHQEA